MLRSFAIGAERWAGISKLVEEAGEVVQVCGKLLATYGDVCHWEGSHLGERLEEELGDLLAAVDFVLEANPGALRRQAVEIRRAAKLELFRQWDQEIQQSNRIAKALGPLEPGARGK